MFRISNILKAPSNDENEEKANVFATDTGVLVFVKESRLIDFLLIFDYDDLISSNTELVNSEYWNAIMKVGKFQFSDLAFVVAPGIDAGWEFEGSGLYKISSAR